MKEDILALLLQSEKEYRSAVKTAVADGEKYVAGRRKEQESQVSRLKTDFRAYEESESENLEQTLLDESGSMEREAAGLKMKMKQRQEEKAELISLRLKEEVLSLLCR